jgi:alginate O-acetyltransferase complex protein AlgJ
MESVAAELAVFLNRHVQLAKPAEDPRYSRRSVQASRVGDIVDMLKLPEDQALFRPQDVRISQVVDGSGDVFEPSAEAEVLLLGDSFTNIFTEEFMGWGSAAGLAPQLAMELGRRIDVIAQNDSGAFATRAALALELEQGTPRLDGKKVVVWEFAARELAVGNWKHIDWQKAMKGTGP